jgi:hypothetical protein
MRGPKQPVCKDTETCEEPAVGVLLQSNRIVARVKSGSGGRYRLKLRPERYGVTTPKRGVGAGLIPRSVRVPKGRLTRFDFHIDTGLQWGSIAADAGFAGVGHEGSPIAAIPDEVVMCPRSGHMTSSGEWAVLGSNQ